VSASFGSLRYCGANTWTTPLQKMYIDLRQVNTLMRMYSSTRSPATPYASILAAAEAKFTCSILLHMEVIIMSHSVKKLSENLPWHPKATPEKLFLKHPKIAWSGRHPDCGSMSHSFPMVIPWTTVSSSLHGHGKEESRPPWPRCHHRTLRRKYWWFF
jgi:hypothetical protein